MTTLDASTMLKAAAHVYATCRSYVDEGTSITTFTDSGHQAVVSFSTRYARQGLFRFEYRANNMGLMEDHLVVVSRQGSASLWWSVHGNREDVSLPDALASATGVSGGVAHVVPRLLMPEVVTGQSVLDLEGVRHAGEAMDDGVECAVLEGVLPRRGPVVLWLDRARFLLRKVVQPPLPIAVGAGEMEAELQAVMKEHVLQASAQLGLSKEQAEQQAQQFLKDLAGSDPAAGIITTQTTLYRPAIGAELPEDLFRYTPPR